MAYQSERLAAAARIESIGNSVAQSKSGSVIGTIAVGGPGGPGLVAQASGGGIGYMSVAVSGGPDIKGLLDEIATQVRDTKPNKGIIKRLLEQLRDAAPAVMLSAVVTELRQVGLS